MFPSLESILVPLKLAAATAGGAMAGVASTALFSAIAIGSWVLFAWLITAWLVARGATGRGRSAFGWFLLAILLAPPVAALMLLVLPDLGQSRQRRLAAGRKAGLRLCPSCAEVVRLEARCCRYCGVDLERIDRHRALQTAPPGRIGIDQRSEPRIAPAAERRAETALS